MLILKKKYGFFNNGDKYICYVYEDVESKRSFSVSNRITTDILYINEIDETFNPSDNVYSTLVANDLNEAKSIIKSILLN